MVRKSLDSSIGRLVTTRRLMVLSLVRIPSSTSSGRKAYGLSMSMPETISSIVPSGREASGGAI